ncbi:hypothetical protein [Streptomyces sp. NBC_00829]|nr:hypothetical protein OG293_01930 [Streptomyces sp. NBC_00829]
MPLDDLVLRRTQDTDAADAGGCVAARRDEEREPDVRYVWQPGLLGGMS